MRCRVGLVAVVVVLAAGLFASTADKPEGGAAGVRPLWRVFDKARGAGVRGDG